MTHKLSTVVFAQGWLDGQFESLVNQSAEKANEDPTAHLIATQMQEQWVIVSNAVDQLIRDNADLERRLAIVRSAV
jgi:hypothetical protein